MNLVQGIYTVSFWGSFCHFVGGFSLKSKVQDFIKYKFLGSKNWELRPLSTQYQLGAIFVHQY